MSGKRFRSLLSKKQHSEVLLYYDTYQCRSVVEKIIHRDTLTQLLYYQSILRKQSYSQLSIEIQSRISIQGNCLYVKSKFYTCKTLKTSIINHNNKNMYLPTSSFIPLLTSLMKIFIYDGDRQFMPTPANIFVEETAAYVNLNSIVGIDFIQSRSHISRQDFMEIATLLTPSLIQSIKSGHKVDYVKLKQRALLLAIVALIENTQFMLNSFQQIPQKLTIQKAAKFIVKMNSFLTSYLTSKTFKQKLKEKNISLNIYQAIQAVIVKDVSFSWPQLIELLVIKHPKNDIDQRLQQNAKSHWRQLPVPQKVFLQQSKIVKQCQADQNLDKKSINLYLTLYTNALLSSLLAEGSFSGILTKQSNFDSQSCSIVTGLISIKNQLEEQKRMGKYHKPHFTRQQSNQVCIPQQKRGDGVCFQDLIEIASKKMVMKIPRSKGPPILIEHPMLQSMRLYSHAFR